MKSRETRAAMWPERSRDEVGAALLAVIVAISVLLGLGISLVLVTLTETGIAANYRDGMETLYAADAAIERALVDLAMAPDWDAVLSGATRSAFVDGSPGGTRTLGGTTLDLSALTNRIRCGVPTACSVPAMDAVTAQRPWGSNNPRWELFGYGPLARIQPTAGIDSRAYVIVWVADDPGENDGDPLRDGQPPFVVDSRNPDNPGRHVVMLLAHAYGAAGLRRVVEATVGRTEDSILPPLAKVRILAWREIR